MKALWSKFRGLNKWVQSTIWVALVVLVVSGASASGVQAGKDRDLARSELKTAQSQIEAAKIESGELKQQVLTAEAAADTAATEASAAVRDAEAKGKQAGVEEVKAAQTKLKAREVAVNQREDAAKTRESEVKAREDAVTGVENVIAQNTFDDGQYEVGKDIAPGSYHTDGGSSCYWEITSDPNGDNILQNDIGAGPRNVSVRAGQWLKVQDCGTWKLR